VFISTQGVPEKPLPSIPSSFWARTWGKMSIKYRVFVILGLQAFVLLTIGMALLAANSRSTNGYEFCTHRQQFKMQADS
jgi:hypothetical protein